MSPPSFSVIMDDGDARRLRLRSFWKEPKLVLGLDRAVGLVGLVPCPGISKIRLVGHLAASKAVREREISSTS